jgi:DNA-binding MarR family transcriptional regulator
VPESSESVGFLVADISRLMRRAFQARLEGGPVTFAQARALVYLARGQGLRQVDLADQLEVQPITLARLVDQLAEAGLVERRADPADRRAYRLHLTGAAAPVLAQVRAIAGEVRDEALAGLTQRESAQLVAALGKVRGALAGSTRLARQPLEEA